ncbi:GNAT family N-acetyltransferase, partial [Yersinia enterocolitica]|nr:GNAT family N-acetyltransferase [Yersinia enterocolitica]
MVLQIITKLLPLGLKSMTTATP